MTKEEREKAIATAIEVFEHQIKRSEDVKCGECEECGEIPFEDYCIKDVAKWLSLAIQALKQEPCEDTISRSRLKECFHRNVVCGEAFDDLIDAQPSVTPTREHGEWIEHHRTDLGEKLNDMCECSRCNTWFSISELLRRSFCPNCGADMRKWIKESKQ